MDQNEMRKLNMHSRQSSGASSHLVVQGNDENGFAMKGEISSRLQSNMQSPMPKDEYGD